MVYSKQTWTDGPSGSTPISAARLGHMEDGIATAADAALGVYARPTGVAATDTAALQTAIATAQATSQDLYLLPGTFSLTSGLIWNANKGSLIGSGDVVLDFTSLTSGYALTLTGNGIGSSGAYSHRSVNYRIAGFRMNGPDTDASTVDGILIGDAGVGAVGADNVSLEHLMIYGFRDGISYGDNTWLVKHEQIAIGACHRYGINGTQGVNAGEMMHYFGCVVYNCQNAAGTAAGLYVPATGPYLDFFFYGGSFDYNNTAAVIDGHHVEFIGTHFEDKNTATPMVQAANTGGQAPTDIGFVGATFAPTEPLPGRDALVVTKATSGSDRVNIAFHGQGGKYDTSTTLYKNLSSTLPTVSLNGFNFDAGGATRVTQYGPAFNQLANGSFDTNTTVANGLGGWTVPAGFDFYTTVARSAPYSLRAISGSTGTAYQVVPVRPAAPLSVTGYVSCNNYTSGTAVFQIQFLAADRTTVLSTLVLKTVSGTQGFTGYQRRVMPPPGATFASVQWVATSFVGTAQLDDVQVVLP